LDYVRADPGQIEQVILNLVVNARDAMPQGGRLDIVTENIDLDKSVAEIYRVTPGPQVGLMIIDTGVGIESETQRHIFEPFFTTKELGKGTGLGLAIVYGIVKQSGGHIQVDSTPGRGTIFRIYLPRAEKAVPRAASPAESPPSLEGRETILLVEDEASVRLIARKFLKSRGYKVLEAGQAEEAQQLCRQHAGQIDLLITDVIMPGMSGPQLAENLTLSCPHLKVLYISGYTDEILGQHQAQIVGLSFLEKPFTSDALALKVREALDRAD
jgi:CheY-like chemotaxis protein